jgi:VCBS repeat-containing protein
MSYTFVNAQPTLTLNQLMMTEGLFPSRDGGGALDIPMGAIRTFAGAFSFGSAAHGQLASIAQSTALFSLLGTTFGGNGQTNFALPNLDGRIMVGSGQGIGLTPISLGETVGSTSLTLNQTYASPIVGGSGLPFDNRGPELAVTYAIKTTGIFPSESGGGISHGFMGEVMPFATNFAPAGWMAANGQLLSIAQNQALFSLLGTTYGGDGVSTFALPDLRGRAVMGVAAGDQIGQVVGTETHTITSQETPLAQGGGGQPIENRAPTIELNYLIAIQGVYPSRDAGSMVGDEPTLGEVVLSAVSNAGSDVPSGWALAQGQLLSIQQNTALFSLLGTTYGGNGTTTFALPDLRGKTVVGTGTGYLVGQTDGQATSSLVYTNETPYIAGSAGSGYTENGPAAAIATSVTALAVDNTRFTNGSLTVALTGTQSGDALAIGAIGGISVSGNSVSYDLDGGGPIPSVVIGTLTTNSATSLTVALNNQASTAAVKALAEAFTFSSTSEDPGSGARTATFTLVDGGGTANGGHDTASFTTSVAVTPVNDAPTVTVPGAPYTNGAGLTGIVFADPDGGSGQEKVTFTVGAGGLSATASSGVTLGGTATALTATGTVADLNAFISGGHLSYAGPSTSLGVSIDDQGNAGGSAKTASASIGLDLNRPPSTPTDSNAANNSVAEGAAAGTAVGVTAASTDPESAAISYSLTANAGGAFAIDATTGVVTVADPSKIDYEANHSLNITVAASDGVQTASQTFTIAVTDVNDVPPTITSGGTGTEAENTAIGNVVYQATASDADTVGTVTYSLGGADAGLFNLTSAGALTFKAAPDYEHPADAGGDNVYNVTITASDGVNTSAAKAVAISVTNANDPPTITSDGGGATATKTVVENTAAVTTVTATDPEGATPTFSLNGGADAGKFAINPTTGVLTFQTAPDFEQKADADGDNVYTVVVRASDGTATVDQTVNVTVGDVNETPDLTPNTPAAASYTENAAPVALLAGAHVADPDAPANFAGGSLTVQITAGSAAGDQLVLLASSGLTVSGTTLMDGATALGEVTGLGTTSVSVSGLLASATAAEVDKVAQAFGFQNTTDNPGAVDRTVSFTFNDGARVSPLFDTVAQTVHVTPVNDPPTAVADTGSANEDGSAVALSVLANDTDADSGDSKTLVSATTSTAGATVTVDAAAGTVSYNPGALFQSLRAGQTTTDTFTYTMKDGANAQSTATVTMTITGVNDAPTAVADSGSANEDGSAVTISVLANDTDADSGDSKTLVSATTSTAGATVTVDAAAGTVSYDPGALFQSLKAGQTTTDTFTYTMKDGANVQSTATVTMTITGVNDAPTAVADTGSANEDGSAVTVSVLANDTDPDNGDSKTLVSATTSTAGATVTVDAAAGTVSYNPGALFQSLRAGQTTTDTFSYTMKDGANAQSTATVTMTITGVNDAPTAVADTGAVGEDGPALTLDVLANDTDPDGGDSKTLVSAANSTAGATVTADVAAGTVSYNPGALFQSLGAGQTTTDTFTYTMKDGANVQSTATVTVTVTGANDAPTAVADTGAVGEDGPAVTLTAASLLANDTDVDAGDTKTLVSVQAAGARGLVALVGGDVVYNPAGRFEDLDVGQSATDTFTYTMQDRSGALSTATVTMTIAGAYDEPPAGPGPSGPSRFPLLGQDSFAGLASNDTFAGGDGDDTLDGGEGADSLDGDRGADSVAGGEGGDFLRGLDDNDRIDGGAGDDTVNGNKGEDSVHGGAGQDWVYGGQGADSVDGGEGDDPYVNGNIGDDLVHGGVGNDSVYGGQNNDTVYGDEGNDRLSGDLGDDILFGGAGADRFVFGANSGADWVLDFNAGQGDLIQIGVGVTYTVSIQPQQVIITLSDGGVIGLSGVTTFDPSWIVTG